MTHYEKLSLALTGLYDLLTFGLLSFVAYEAVIKPKLANVAVSFQGRPEDTQSYSWQRQLMDIVIENRGPEIYNVVIKSEPDYLGWGNTGPDDSRPPRKTSEYFKRPIPYFANGERLQFFWSDTEANKEVLAKPFKIIIEYDNTVCKWFGKKTKAINVDFTVYDGTYFGLNNKYDIHNVAQETARIRELFDKTNKLLSELIKSVKK